MTQAEWDWSNGMRRVCDAIRYTANYELYFAHVMTRVDYAHMVRRSPWFYS